MSPSPRSDLRAHLSAASLVSIAAIAQTALFGGGDTPALVGLTTLAAIVIVIDLPVIAHAAFMFLFAAVLAVTHVPWVHGAPVLPLLLPLAASTLLVVLRPRWRSTLTWVRLGTVDPASAALAILTGLGSALALVAWASWTNNLGAGAAMLSGVMSAPTWLVAVFAIPIFALANAVVEELVYRGVLQSAMSRCGFPFLIANVAQSAAFAALHYEMGFPNGAIGYVMVFSYGCILGWLKQHTNGMALPIATHVAADLAIGYYLLWLAR